MLILRQKLFFDYEATGLTKKGQKKLAEERRTIAKAAKTLYRDKMKNAGENLAAKKEVQENMLGVIKGQKDKALKRIAKKNTATPKSGSIFKGFGKMLKKVA